MHTGSDEQVAFACKLKEGCEQRRKEANQASPRELLMFSSSGCLSALFAQTRLKNTT